MEVLIFFVFGLILGSFLNVCIYRMPRKISIIKPYSFCPDCRNSIKIWHNIPVLSYIALKGKCAYCGAKISLRYPLVEILNGVLYVFAYLKFGLTPYILFILILISTIIVISFIDLEFQIIPDQLSIPLIFLGFILSFLSHNYEVIVSDFQQSLIGILVGGGSLFAISIISKGGMGGGDIKLNAAFGAFFGWKASLLTIFIGSLIGAIVGIVVFRKTGNRRIPFGPFLSIGALVCLFFGEKVLSWYFG